MNLNFFSWLRARMAKEAMANIPKMMEAAQKKSE
jgi:hypothetical protein